MKFGKSCPQQSSSRSPLGVVLISLTSPEIEAAPDCGNVVVTVLNSIVYGA